MNTNVLILAIAAAMVDGKPGVTLTYTAPFDGRAYVHASPLGTTNWLDPGWFNSPCYAGTNTVTVKAPPYWRAAQYRVMVQR